MSKEEALGRIVDLFAMLGLIVIAALSGFIAGKASRDEER